GKSQERGVYRTLDGGLSWERVLFVSDSTACIDIVMNPQDPDVLFASMWERRRFPHRRVYGGVTSGIYRSQDGGDTWTLLAGGLPEPNTETGRIGLAISPSQPSVIYASYTTNPVTNVFDGVYRSLDNGENWSRVDDGSIAGVFASFGWFFGNMRVHPNTPDSVYIMGLTSYYSWNAGWNWASHSKSNVHVDHHALEIHPLDPDFQVAGTDGGVYITHDGGDNWEHVRTLPITQFYTSEVDARFPERVYGGTQDNGTVRTFTGAADQWERILGGDGFYVIVDPQNNSNVYAEWQWGNLSKSIDGGNVFLSAVNGIDPADRTNWNTPVVMNPVNASSLYYGAHRLYKSTDGADFWAAISDDLTNPDPDYLGGEFSGTISTIAVAPSDTNVIYVGTDDGMVQVTFNDGEDWEVISEGLPLSYVTRVAVDPYDALHVYVTLSGYREVNYQPHVFHSFDGGQYWIDISGDLPEVPVNDIIIDPDLDQTLYVATDLGVWYTRDGGVSWDILGTDLPMTVCNDLTLHRETRKLVVGTFGRSMYSYDLGQPTSLNEPDLAQLDFAVYPNPVTTDGQIRTTFKGPQHIQVDLMTMGGQHVRTISRGGVPAGTHSISWQLRDEPAGLYVIRLTSGSHVTSRTVLIQ
ncbi:MAG: T9SS type A sorting domain-containing protein, partial [Saprospiraceae bacterium]|nr:T9SS type A sorting domain-containing protein [Saprospiraceae bacterium]